jgi:hypothetical protein
MQLRSVVSWRIMIVARAVCLVAAAVVASAAGATAAFADCTCRAGGRNYELGQTACISTPQGFRLAVCGMVLNNTSWRISTDACVAAHEQHAPSQTLSRKSAARPATLARSSMP